MAYCIYLRKSRKDLEAEQQGAGETLARHRDALLALANRCGYAIGHIYTELVSGDTIASRPVMQQLLNDVQDGRWEGVLVYDIARLARGDTMDQGIVAQTFRYSTPPTLIITPDRVFDPENDADEEYFEFNLFFARREYKSITRRMQAGRSSSAYEGKYPGAVDPYGYERYKLKNEKGWSLRIVPSEASVVRMIFDLCINGRDTMINGKVVHEEIGAAKIADMLNEMGLRTKRGNAFTASSIRQLIHNPIYSGKIQWYRREKKVQMVDGQRVIKRPFSSKRILSDGRHDAIVSQEVWDAAQSASLGRNHASVNRSKDMVNPLSGLVKCSECGFTMVRSANSKGVYYLKCPTNRCPTSSCPMDDAEAMILEAISNWIGMVESDSAAPLPVAEDSSQAPRAAALSRVADLEKRRERLMELLEEGTYDSVTYTQRMAVLIRELESAKASLDAMPEHVPTMQERLTALLPTLRHVVQVYDAAQTAAEKNKLLRSVIDNVVYHKTHRCNRGENAADFVTLDVFPR